MVDEAHNPLNAGWDRPPQKISTQKLREFYVNDLLPLIGAKGSSRDPRFDVIYGQPGSGKSTTVRLLAGRVGATQVINGDELLGYVDTLEGLVLPPGEELEESERKDHFKSLYNWLMHRAFSNRQNIITEAVKEPQIRWLVEQAASERYPARLHAISTDQETSFRRVLLRRHRGLANGTTSSCVVGDKEWHDSWYHDIPAGLHALEEDKLFGRITVRRPDGSELYNNVLVEQSDGTREWHQPKGAVEALIKGRHEPPNMEEIERDWAIITSSKLLKADPACRDLPLDAYREDALASARARGQFNVSKPDPSHQEESAKEYGSAVARDLNGAMGSVDKGNAAALRARLQAFWQEHENEISENFVQSMSLRASVDASRSSSSRRHLDKGISAAAGTGPGSASSTMAGPPHISGTKRNAVATSREALLQEAGEAVEMPAAGRARYGHTRSEGR